MYFSGAGPKALAPVFLYTKTISAESIPADLGSQVVVGQNFYIVIYLFRQAVRTVLAHTHDKSGTGGSNSDFLISRKGDFETGGIEVQRSPNVASGNHLFSHLNPGNSPSFGVGLDFDIRFFDGAKGKFGQRLLYFF